MWRNHLKVFVSVSLDVAAERVMNDQRGDVEKYSSIEEAKELLAKRAETESIRYKDIYNLNYMDFSNYNLIIDSTYTDPNTVAETIIKEARTYYASPTNTSKRLVSPKRLTFDNLLEDEDKIRLKDLIKEMEYDRLCTR